MAKYHLIASINHPEENGWTRERYPDIATNYDELTTAIYQEQMDKAMQIMLEHFGTDSNNVETHDDWTDRFELDEDGDGFYLFQRIPSVTGVIGGEPFSAFEDIHGCLTIEYCNTEGRREWYFPCEEDADYLRPFIHASNLEMGHYPEQKACEDIAKIMKSWDYNIKL